MPKKVAVIDGNSLMHRAYHAIQTPMMAPDGTPTNAVFGFLSMLLKFIETMHPDAVVCAFDAGKPQFRINELESYKAQRPPMDNELRVQFPVMEELLESMGIPVVKVPGWEGDDILGTVAARNEERGFETLLVTGDKDAYQLASELTHVVTTKKGVTDIAIYGPDEVFDRYGVTPEQFVDYLGLMGDSSDNIPGVPGIGAKTAEKLLTRFGSMDGIYNNLSELKGKQLENLRNNKDTAYLSRRIATIMRDLDFPLDVDELTFPEFDAAIVEEVFRKYALTSPLARVLKLVGQEPTVSAQQCIEPNDIVVGESGVALVHEAVNAGICVSLAFETPEQSSLFEPSLVGAFAIDDKTAVLEGNDALEALVYVVQHAPFAALDTKQVLHYIYPTDTALPALITDDELFGAAFFDVSVAAYVLDSSASAYTYHDLALRYLDAQIEEGKTIHDRVAAYALCVRALIDPLKEALKKDGSEQVYAAIDLPLVPVLAMMERTGAALDSAHLAHIGEKTTQDVVALSDQIYELAGETFNIDSPKQLGHILFEVMGLPPLKKNSRGYSTDARVLKELSKIHPIAELVLRYRELTKIKSTYIDALPLQRKEDGRIHTQFNETVTTTGRLSSSDPNLQNIPVRSDFGREIRQCFVPLTDDAVFMSADYSQIELRLLAHLSGDEHLVDAFNSGADFHASTASRVFGVPIDEVTPELRSRAKAVNFGIVYGQQAYGLSQSLDIPFGEAKDMIDRYFEAYPGVRHFLDKTIADAKISLVASTMEGRKRRIKELSSSNAQQRAFGERTAMNHPMQGSAADIIKMAMINVVKRMRDEGFQAKLMLQVHDELDFSVPKDEVERLAVLVKEVMESVVDLKVSLDVDVEWGESWAQAH